MAAREDQVVKEVDVYLSKQLVQNLYLLQFPVRPAHLPYDDVPHLSARVKPQQAKVEVELAVNTSSPNYCGSKGEQIAINVDGPNPEEENAYFSTNMMDKQLLTSMPAGVSSERYVAGIYKGGELHLTPLKAIVQLRPSFSYLDKVDSRLTDHSGDGDASQDEEEEAKQVMVKFARQETEEAKARRLASYEYMKKKQQEEAWVPVTHHHANRLASINEKQALYSCHGGSVPEFNLNSCDYLERLVPKMEEEETKKPALPTNVLSMSDLKSMNLSDQIKALLTNAKVIRFNQLLSLLPKGSDSTAALRCLQQVSLLVQGCWVVKSEVLYPKDTFSAHSGVPAEPLCRGRDYIMWRFTHTPYLLRKDISSVIKLPAEDVKDILEQMACLKVNKGWEFLMSYDAEFVNRHPEVVQRQQMLWNAKFQQLSKVINITKADQKAAASATTASTNTPPKRRRTSSRSRTKSGSEFSMSDLSDSDMDVVKQERTRHISGSVDVVNKHKSGSTSKNRSVSFSEEVNGDKSDVMTAEEPVGKNNSHIPSPELLHALIDFLKEKYCSRYVLNSTDLKTLFTRKLAECSPGHILSTGVSEQLLQQVSIDIGCKKFEGRNPQDEPIFLISKIGDGLDSLRSVLTDILSQQSRFKFSQLKKKIEEIMGENPSETELRKLLRDYCVTKNGLWHLKGTITDKNDT